MLITQKPHGSPYLQKISVQCCNGSVPLSRYRAQSPRASFPPECSPKASRTVCSQARIPRPDVRNSGFQADLEAERSERERIAVALEATMEQLHSAGAQETTLAVELSRVHGHLSAVRSAQVC